MVFIVLVVGVLMVLCESCCMHLHVPWCCVGQAVHCLGYMCANKGRCGFKLYKGSLLPYRSGGATAAAFLLLWQLTLLLGSSVYICACAQRICGSYNLWSCGGLHCEGSGSYWNSLSQFSVDSHEIEIPKGTHWVVDFSTRILWEST